MRSDLEYGCHSIDEDGVKSSTKLDAIVVFVCIIGVAIMIGAAAAFGLAQTVGEMFLN